MVAGQSKGLPVRHARTRDSAVSTTGAGRCVTGTECQTVLVKTAFGDRWPSGHPTLSGWPGSPRRQCTVPPGGRGPHDSLWDAPQRGRSLGGVLQRVAGLPVAPVRPVLFRCGRAAMRLLAVTCFVRARRRQRRWPHGRETRRRWWPRSRGAGVLTSAPSQVAPPTWPPVCPSASRSPSVAEPEANSARAAVLDGRWPIGAD